MKTSTRMRGLQVYLDTSAVYSIQSVLDGTRKSGCGHSEQDRSVREADGFLRHCRYGRTTSTLYAYAGTDLAKGWSDGYRNFTGHARGFSQRCMQRFVGNMGVTGRTRAWVENIWCCHPATRQDPAATFCETADGTENFLFLRGSMQGAWSQPWENITSGF